MKTTLGIEAGTIVWIMLCSHVVSNKLVMTTIRGLSVRMAGNPHQSSCTPSTQKPFSASLCSDWSTVSKPAATQCCHLANDTALLKCDMFAQSKVAQAMTLARCYLPNNTIDNYISESHLKVRYNFQSTRLSSYCSCLSEQANNTQFTSLHKIS
jgi:hypothetical protein